MPRHPVLTVPNELLVGTRISHLPYGIAQAPRMTVIFRRKEGETFEMGFAVCSLGDAFVKAIGRKLAYQRLVRSPVVGTPAELRKFLWDHLKALEEHRPGTISDDTLFDMADVLQQLPERFAFAEAVACANSCTEFKL